MRRNLLYDDVVVDQLGSSIMNSPALLRQIAVQIVLLCSSRIFYFVAILHIHDWIFSSDVALCQRYFTFHVLYTLYYYYFYSTLFDVSVEENNRNSAFLVALVSACITVSWFEIWPQINYSLHNALVLRPVLELYVWHTIGGLVA